MEHHSDNAGVLQYRLACNALDKTDWLESKKLFTELLEIEELPQVLEKYAWSNWWLGDEIETVTARERAYSLYLKINDLQSAARLALWIAYDYLEFRGDTVIANGWRLRARRLLKNQELVPEHGWLALQSGAVAIELENRPDTAIKYARKAIKIGRSLQVADLEVIGMAMEGLALVSKGKIVQGMPLLDEAGSVASSGALQELYSATWTFCYLIYACERLRDVERVKQWCTKMKELSERINFRFTLGICRVHYAGTLIWQGKWQDAETELEESLSDLESTRPPYVMECLARLGELRRRQGRFTEAEHFFSQAEYHPISMLGKAALYIDKDSDYKAADEMVSRYIRLMPAENELQMIPALELKVRILSEAGKPELAEKEYLKLSSIIAGVNTDSAQGLLYYTGGLLAICKNKHEEARQKFQDALHCFSKCNIEFEAAHARLDLARAFLKTGNISSARSEAKNAMQAFERLGAIHGKTSTLRFLSSLSKKSDRVKFYVDRNGVTLTQREIEVLKLVAEGKTDQQIAELLFRSKHTIHRHVSNILSKLNVSTRTAAVALLVKNEKR